MTNKQFKRTEIETPQAAIVLKAIEDLKEFDLKQLDEKCAEFGLITTSKRGIRMVADWYRRIFKEDGLVVEIKVEKPVKKQIKETKTSPRKKSSANQSEDTHIVEMSEIISKVNKEFVKEKGKKLSKKLSKLTWDSVSISDKYELENGCFVEIFDMGEDDGEPYITIHSNDKELKKIFDESGTCMSSGKFNRLNLRGYLIR